jgi:hypothetical protein
VFSLGLSVLGIADLVDHLIVHFVVLIVNSKHPIGAPTHAKVNDEVNDKGLAV